MSCALAQGIIILILMWGSVPIVEFATRSGMKNEHRERESNSRILPSVYLELETLTNALERGPLDGLI
jgi:hypothetical protein